MRYVLVSIALLGCNGKNEGTCGPFDEVFVWADTDADGFGGEAIGWTCTPGPGESAQGNDCDDADPTAFPGAGEGCDLVDNDCDGRVDEDSVQSPWFLDGDQDGYGAGEAGTLACMAPGPDYVTVAGDCDDALPAVNPAGLEVCNGGVDDDCDGFADDDGGVDPTTETPWYRDLDLDGYGDDRGSYMACAAPTPSWIAVGGDCDDEDDAVHPAATEVCNDIDDDCDDLVDDADDYVDPAGQREFFADADLDGYGDPYQLTMACEPSPGAVTNGDDCDDGDPKATVPRDWVLDFDQDGVGVGGSIAFDCHSPGAGTAPLEAGVDCDDNDNSRFPGNPEVCEDGLDQDCSGDDKPCATWLYTVRETDNFLRRVDIDTLTWEDIGPLGVPFDFGDLAYDPDTRTLYMVDGWGLLGLYTVDLTTGQATLIGFHGVGDLFGLTFDTSTGTLYASAWIPNGFYQLDVATAQPSWIGNPGRNLDGITYDEIRDQVVGFDSGGGDLWRVDRATGGATLLFGGPFVNNGGLAYEPNNDMYWTIDWSGEIYGFDPNNGYSRTTRAVGLGPHDGFVYVPNPPN